MMHRFDPLPGERIIVSENIHWKNYIFPGLLAVVCLVSLVFRACFLDVSLVNRIVGSEVVPARWQARISLAEVVFLGILTLLSVAAMIRTAYKSYYLTTMRLIATSGVFRRYIGEMLLDKCETICLNQTVYERLFGTGDILAVAPGSHLFMDDVRHALAFRQTVLREIFRRKGEIQQ